MDGCREEDPLTRLGDQETLLRRRTSVEEKVRVRWRRGKIFQTEGTEHARNGGEREGVLWGSQSFLVAEGEAAWGAGAGVGLDSGALCCHVEPDLPPLLVTRTEI